jgi:hypothetical protein
MRKLFALGLAAGLLAPSLALAEGNHPMAGCGLAYVLFASKDNSKPIQVIGATTNQWGTQTFGISSGTSGCTDDGAVKFVAQAELYAEINLKELSRDIAAGRGEYLDAFSALIGVKTDKRSAFGGFAQEKFAVLFPSADTSSTQMLNTLSRELSVRPDLIG